MWSLNKSSAERERERAGGLGREAAMQTGGGRGQGQGQAQEGMSSLGATLTLETYRYTGSTLPRGVVSSVRSTHEMDAENLLDPRSPRRHSWSHERTKQILQASQGFLNSSASV